MLCRPVAFALQPLWIRLVRWISRWIYRASDHGAPSENSFAAFSGYLFPRGMRRLRHRTHRLPALRRWRLRQAHNMALAVGHGFAQRRSSYNRNVCAVGLAGRLPRLSNAALRICHLARHRRISLAHGNEIPARPQAYGPDFCRLPDSDRHRAFPGRIHPHQPALVFGFVQRASRKRALHPDWRSAVVMVYVEEKTFVARSLKHFGEVLWEGAPPSFCEGGSSSAVKLKAFGGGRTAGCRRGDSKRPLPECPRAR